MLCMGCQGLPGGGDSPNTSGGSSTATQGQGAQTIGGDQGQAETPQTNTSGTATNQFKFASEGVDSGIGMRLISMAEINKWTPEQLSSVFKSMNGAPETVDIKIEGGIHNQSGNNENVGSSGGTGSTGAATNPIND
jgi:hypothetical protein